MMQKNNKHSDGTSVGKAVAVGAGVLAVSAGAYYFVGPDGKKHQKKALRLINKTENKIVHGVQSFIEEGKKAADNAVEAIKEFIKK